MIKFIIAPLLMIPEILSALVSPPRIPHSWHNAIIHNVVALVDSFIHNIRANEAESNVNWVVNVQSNVEKKNIALHLRTES